MAELIGKQKKFVEEYLIDLNASQAAIAPGSKFPFPTIVVPQAINNLPVNQEDSVKLNRNQLCPIHRSLSCCGREAIPKERRQRQMGVRRIDDPQHPRGYRELRSNGEMRKLLDRKIVAQNGICGICKEKFTDYSDVVPDHISPRGMGGAWRDDHPDNIQAVHWWCNGEKGSTRV